MRHSGRSECKGPGVGVCWGHRGTWRRSVWLGQHGRCHVRPHSMYSGSEWGCQRGLRTICSRSKGAPRRVCVPGRRTSAHRRTRVGAGFAVLPPGHVEAAHKLGVEGMRGVEHGEAQDIGGVLHNPVQVQDGEVLGPRRRGEAWGQAPRGADTMGGVWGPEGLDGVRTMVVRMYL